MPDHAKQPDPTERLIIRLTAEDKRRARVAAALENVTLSAFVRRAIRLAARDAIETSSLTGGGGRGESA